MIVDEESSEERSHRSSDCPNTLTSGDSAKEASKGSVLARIPLSLRQISSTFRTEQLPDGVVEYLLRRVPRNSEAIFDLLDRVDEAAFAKKRRLTVPFIREFEKDQV